MPDTNDESREDPEVAPTRDLVAQYLAGDGAAERDLFARHRAQLLAQARKHPRIGGLARFANPEDLVQQVFVRALSSGLLHKLDDRGPGSLRNALFRILDRVIVDGHRHHHAEKRGGNERISSYDHEPGGEDLGPRSRRIPSDATTPTVNARTEELIELCRRILEPREWDVWRLKELEGLNSSEIGERLGMPAATVRGVLSGAKKKAIRALASLLEAPPEEESD